MAGHSKNPGSGVERIPVWDRFNSKIFKAEGHWLWVGACKPTGYGMFWFRADECFIAHRASWILHRGEIPEGLVVDHICKVKSCVNPDHLRLVTQQFNSTVNSVSPMARNKAKTHCSKGHPLTPENIAVQKRPGYITKTGNRVGACTARTCLICYPGYWRYALVPRPRPPRRTKS